MSTWTVTKDGKHVQREVSGKHRAAQVTEPGKETGSRRLAAGVCEMGNGKKAGKGILGRGDGGKVRSEFCPHGVGWQRKTAGCLGELGQTGKGHGRREEQRSEHSLPFRML